MIEVENNRVKCEIGTKEPDQLRSAEQIALYQEVVNQFKLANQLFEKYKREYGTDKRAINRILNMLNGGTI